MVSTGIFIIPFFSNCPACKTFTVASATDFLFFPVCSFSCRFSYPSGLRQKCMIQRFHAAVSAALMLFSRLTIPEPSVLYLTFDVPNFVTLTTVEPSSALIVSFPPIIMVFCVSSSLMSTCSLFVPTGTVSKVALNPISLVNFSLIMFTFIKGLPFLFLE